MKHLAILFFLSTSLFAAASDYVTLYADIKSGKFVDHIPSYQTLNATFSSEEIESLSNSDRLKLQAYYFANCSNFEEAIWGKLDSKDAHCFAQIAPLSKKHPNSGWKLHISADEKTANQIALIFVPLLLHFEIPSKIASTLSFLDHLSEDSVQAGKFITIYPKNYKQTKKFAHQLNEIAIQFNLQILTVPTLLGDARLGESGLIFVRYGKHLEHRKNEKTLTFISPSGKREKKKRILDCRSFPFPEFIWKHTSKALAGDEKPFPNMTFQWTFPGSRFVVDLHQIHSWETVLNPDYISDDQITNDPLFQRINQELLYNVI